MIFKTTDDGERIISFFNKAKIESENFAKQLEKDKIFLTEYFNATGNAAKQQALLNKSTNEAIIMINYIRMKRNERKIKTMLYGAILSVMENRRGTLTLIHKLCAALKDVPEEELKIDVMQKLSEIIHSEHQES